MGDTDLPKADVIRFLLDNGTEFMIRPSGTKAKIKVYLFQTEGDSTAEAVENSSLNRLRHRKHAETFEERLVGHRERILGGIKWKFGSLGIFDHRSGGEHNQGWGASNTQPTLSRQVRSWRRNGRQIV